MSDLPPCSILGPCVRPPRGCSLLEFYKELYGMDCEMMYVHALYKRVGKLEMGYEALSREVRALREAQEMLLRAVEILCVQGGLAWEW